MDDEATPICIRLLLLLPIMLIGCVSGPPVTPATDTRPTLIPSVTPTPDFEATYEADPCNPPPEMAVDGIAEATVFAWVDADADGVHDADEPPLAGVEVLMDYPFPVTDENGMVEASEFQPGCACDCWQNVELIITVPEGYRATTPAKVMLIGPNLTYEFGFIRLEDEEPLEFPGEPDWYMLFAMRGLIPIKFDYDENLSILTVTLSTTPAFSEVQIIDETESLIYRLHSEQVVDIERTYLTLESFKSKYSCLWETWQSGVTTFFTPVCRPDNGATVP
jgi:hypothetical protein